jgi:hypothetical protein
LKISLPYIEKLRCTQIYGKEKINLSPSQICAGGQKAKDSCSGNFTLKFEFGIIYGYFLGDSGSPLMHFDEKKLQWVLTGVVSFGVRKCGTEGNQNRSSIDENYIEIMHVVYGIFPAKIRSFACILLDSVYKFECVSELLQFLWKFQ